MYRHPLLQRQPHAAHHRCPCLPLCRRTTLLLPSAILDCRAAHVLSSAGLGCPPPFNDALPGPYAPRSPSYRPSMQLIWTSWTCRRMTRYPSMLLRLRQLRIHSCLIAGLLFWLLASFPRTARCRSTLQDTILPHFNCLPQAVLPIFHHLYPLPHISFSASSSSPPPPPPPDANSPF